MSWHRRFISVLSIVLLLSLVHLQPPGARADAGPRATRNMVIYVRDQYGQLTADAEILIRDRASYRAVASLITNADGYAQVVLDTSTWYVVHVYYREHGTREFWTYGYITVDDWGSIYPYGIKTFQRNDPWIDQVTLPEAPRSAGEPLPVDVTLDHALTMTNFGLYVRVRLLIDDDGQAPYLYEQLSEERAIADAREPFTFTPVLPEAGTYLVRAVAERRFEDNLWEVSDASGWAWQVTVASQRVSLEGVLFYDANANDVLDADEPLAYDALLRLYDAEGFLLDQAACDAQGRFSFSDLALAPYRLRVAQLPEGLGRPREVYDVLLSEETQGQTVALPLDPWRVEIPWVIAR